MKWLNRLAALLFGLISVGIVRDLRSRYDFVVFDKNNVEEDEDEDYEGQVGDIINLRPDGYDNAMDLRGTPTHQCVCGCSIFNLKVVFEDYEIATYFLDMECANCGTLVTAPTPLDRNETEL